MKGLFFYETAETEGHFEAERKIKGVRQSYSRSHRESFDKMPRARTPSPSITGREHKL
jgi:hypothetical protein